MNESVPFYKNKIVVIVISALIFVGFLFLLRTTWENAQNNHVDLSIENGKVDFSEIGKEDKRIFSLNGEWEFFPDQFIMNQAETTPAEIISVPSGWNAFFDEQGAPSPYGYGSYRLKVKVNPELQQLYSLKISSIHSASEVFVNNVLIAQSGEPTEEKQSAGSRKNVPYTATFYPDETGVMDIVIQVSNYDYSNQGGITREIKFGTMSAMTHLNRLSFTAQLLVIIVFLIYGLFSLVLYIIGSQNRKLFYFFLLMMSIVISTGFASHEKLLYVFFPIGIQLAFQILSVAALLILFSLIKLIENEETKWWQPISKYFNVLILLIIIGYFLADTNTIIRIQNYSLIFFALAFLIVIIKVIKEITNNLVDNVLLLFSFIAFIHQFAWIIILTITGETSIYYPFDLIIAASLFAIMFLRRYIEAHQQTESYANQLEEANYHRAKFLITVSNELLRPLQSNMTLLQNTLKRDKSKMNEQSVEDVSTALSVNKRLLRIIKNVKDSLNLERFKPQVHRTTVYIAPILRSVLDLLALDIPRSQIKIQWETPEKTPPIYADENRMIQIFYNILFFSMRSAPRSPVKMTVKKIDHALHIQIKVKDLYLQKDVIHRIKQSFEENRQRPLIYEREFEISLRIAKQLIHLQEGHFELTSDKKNGTIYTLRLPIAKSFKRFESFENVESTRLDEQIEQAMAKIPKNRLDQEIKEKPVIMIVESTEYNVIELTTMLPENNYSFQTVFSGEDCLKKLETYDVDLLIVNHILKDMSGYKLIETVRKSLNYTDLPILLLTLNANNEEMLAGFKSGANDYISKPILAEEFNARIETLLTIKKSIDARLNLEASWLQAQIKPHFIFNVINSILALSEVDVDKMRHMLEELSELLRYKFKFYNTHRLTTIQEEMKVTQSYLEIETIRFGERLKVEKEIDETALTVNIPFLTIEPLVENALEHGIMKNVAGGVLTIRILDKGDHVFVSIEDNGSGMTDTKIESLLNHEGTKEGVGLLNTHQRLKLINQQGLNITSTLNVGTTISFKIPK